MPNWIRNSLTVKGTADEVRRFTIEMQGDFSGDHQDLVVENLANASTLSFFEVKRDYQDGAETAQYHFSTRWDPPIAEIRHAVYQYKLEFSLVSFDTTNLTTERYQVSIPKEVWDQEELGPDLP